jgi:tetratricopeptide (TPR) repeat protein
MRKLTFAFAVLASMSGVGADLIGNAPRYPDANAKEAERLFSVAMAFISAGQYESGIAELERAYAVKPHRDLLFNIARAYQDMGRAVDALAFYKRYLASEPPDRDTVEATVAQLEACRAPPPALPGLEPAADEATDSSALFEPSAS